MPLTETEALSKNPTTDDENSQFVGFHGTSQRFAQDLVKGVFDKSHFGAITPGGIASLQFGIGLYVVKAEHPSDDNAFGLAQYFPEYPENHALNFLYSIIGSVERDGADELRKTPKAFVWSRNDVVLGTFPLIVESTPPFHALLLEILKRDLVIQQFLYVDNTDATIFRFQPEAMPMEINLAEKL